MDPIQETESIARRLEDNLVFRSESGAFDTDGDVFASITEKIRTARQQLSNNAYPDARKVLMLATHELNLRLNQKGWKWRAVHIWAIPAFFYYAIMMALFLYIQLWHGSLIDAFEIGIIPFQIFLYGFIGGLIRGIWWLIFKVENRSFRPQFFLPYITGPWMGALLAVFSYALIKAGLLVITSTDGQSTPLTDDTYGIIALVILAGFSWEWVMQAINRLKNKN